MAHTEDYGSPNVHPGESHHYEFQGTTTTHLQDGTFGPRDSWVCHRDGCKVGRDTDPAKREAYLIKALDVMLRDQGYKIIQ